MTTSKPDAAGVRGRRTPPARSPPPLDAPTMKRYLQLRRELASTEARLQTVAAERESANEALRARNTELNFTNEELKASQEELRALNAALSGLNVELSGKVVALEHAERTLRDADRRKDEFLAILSHELRNPLAPIRNGLHVLELAPAGGAAAARAMEIMKRQIAHLARLVDDLLDATRVAHGKLQVERQLVDLAVITQRTAEDHESLFTARGVAFQVTVPIGSVWILGDATRLAQLMGNLLQNAAKFTSSGDSVVLSLEVTAQIAVLLVRDTGIGIDADLLPRIFQRFSQADGALDRRAGGLGLGLALVKGLVEAHGGTVEASSAGRGAGTELVVRLPLATPASTVADPPEAPSTRRRRILVIEDNVDAAESLRLSLEIEGHEVAVAHAGTDGLERAREFSPDVVLCDIGLPQMDGYAIAKALRGEP
ncbi:MAG: hybrid sensor histidine kinase/response regulator, partial [Anaeromyxobacteraceae bacterium]